MKKLAALILITVLLTSCENLIDSVKPEDKYYYLPANYKTDLKAGDVFVYKSDLNNLAKYRVVKIVNGYFWVSRSSKDGIDNHPFNYYECQITFLDSVGKVFTQSQSWLVDNMQNISVPVKFNSQNTRRSDFISISTYSGENSPAPTIINWYNKNSNKPSRYISELKILNRQFENVAWCDIDTTQYKTPGRHIMSFYCNFKQGLLGFKYSNGEIFELVD